MNKLSKSVQSFFIYYRFFSKINKMKKVILIICLLCLTSCQTTKQEEVIPYDEEPSYSVLDIIENGDDFVVPFNTTVKLETLRASDMDELNPIFQDEMKKYSKYFDAYHEYEGVNNIFTINSSYGQEKEIVLDDVLFTLLKEGITLTKLTEGKFNITIGTLFELWRDKFSPFPVENNDPSSEDINKALGCVVSYKDIDSIIELNEDNKSVVFHKYDLCDSSVKINIGAIAKGYALDLCKETLSAYNKPFLINAGTSSIITYTPNKEVKSWIIGIRNPYARVLTLYDYALDNSGSFTTSGDDSNYFLLKDGTVRHHILDATTGYPNTYIKEATIKSNDKAFIGDALSTAFFNCQSLEERLDLLKKIEDYYDIELSFAYFEETTNEGGNLVVDKEFNTYIIPTSIADNIISIEVIE